MRMFALCFCLLTPTLAAAADIVPGPVVAQVLRVIDGDSFVAQAQIWPGQTITVNVRIRGVDAPELRSKCGAERDAARRSRAALARMLSAGPVGMTNIGGGKYYGRVIADVTAPDGRLVATTLIAAAHARPYAGGRRVRFCG